MSKFVGLLNQHRCAADVVTAIHRFSFNELMDAPPDRQYIISRGQGIDLLLENDRVAAVQIFVQSPSEFSAFSEILLFGLKSDMLQADVHQVLGVPMELDAYDGKYALSPEMENWS